MSTGRTLAAIEGLLREMVKEPKQERARTYGAIRGLIADLEESNQDPCNGYISEKILKLRWSCQSIAGLDEGNGHNKRAHYTWAVGALMALRSPLCFGDRTALDEAIAHSRHRDAFRRRTSANPGTPKRLRRTPS